MAERDSTAEEGSTWTCLLPTPARCPSPRGRPRGAYRCATLPWDGEEPHRAPKKKVFWDGDVPRTVTPGPHQLDTQGNYPSLVVHSTAPQPRTETEQETCRDALLCYASSATSTPTGIPTEAQDPSMFHGPMETAGTVHVHHDTHDMQVSWFGTIAAGAGRYRSFGHVHVSLSPPPSTVPLQEPN